jgi:hypothetical protein
MCGMTVLGLALLAAPSLCGEEKRPDPRAGEVRELRKSYAHKACATSVKLIGSRCFFAAREYLLVAELFASDEAKVAKLKEYLRFVPPMPWKRFPRPVGPGALPESEAFSDRGHSAPSDAAAVNAFWKRGLDRFLKRYLDALDRIRGKGTPTRSVGEAYIAVLGVEDRVPDWGRGGALERAKKSLVDLGWRFGRFKYKWPRWLTPEEAREAGEREAFEQERRQRYESVWAACAAEGAGQDLGEPSDLASSLGLRARRYATAHLEAEGDLTESELRTLLALLHRCLSRTAEVTGRPLPQRFDPRVRLLVLPGEKAFAAFVGGVGELDAGARDAVKEQSIGYADYERGCFGCYAEARDEAFFLSAVQGMLKILFDRLGLYNLPLWLWAGLADKVCIDVVGSIAPSLAAKCRKATPRFEAWYNVTRWNRDMARAAEKGLDPSTSSVLARNNEFEVNNIQRAKMYSCVSFLLTRKKEWSLLARFLATEGWSRSDDGEWKQLRRAGWTVKEFDAAWKAHLRETEPGEGEGK